MTHVYTQGVMPWKEIKSQFVVYFPDLRFDMSRIKERTMQVDTLLSAQKAGGIDKTTITKSIRDQYALIDTCTVSQLMNALT